MKWKEIPQYNNSSESRVIAYLEEMFYKAFRTAIEHKKTHTTQPMNSRRQWWHVII